MALRARQGLLDGVKSILTGDPLPNPFTRFRASIFTFSRACEGPWAPAPRGVIEGVLAPPGDGTQPKNF